MEYGRWLIFFIINAVIFIAWFSLQGRDKQGVAARLLKASVLSSAQIIGSIFLLGGPWAKLTASNLIIINGAFSGALLAAAVARRQAFGALRDLGRAVSSLREIVKWGPVPKTLALLTAIVIVWVVFIGIVYPPVEWDSLMYHLPPVGHFIQQESLADPPLPMGLVEGRWLDSPIWVNAFPKNTELLFLWATIIPGNDTLVDLVELVFGLVGILAVYSLATRLGVERKWAVSAGFLFFLTPIVIAQSRSTYIDLSNNVLILAAVALLYQKNGRRSAADVAVAGIAAGIVLGAKWSGLMFLPVLLIMLVAQRLYWSRRDGLPPLGKTAGEIALFLGPALFFGSYWYVKNWYLYQNPLWPFQLTFFGRQIFSGLITQAEVLSWTFPPQFQNLNMAQMLWATWREVGISDYVTDIRPGGLGPFWFILGLPALFYVGRMLIKRRDWAQASIFIAVAAMLLLHPTNWWTRFTLMIAALGAISFAVVRSAERRREVTRLVDILLIAILLFSTGASIATSYYQPAKIASLLKRRPPLRTSAVVRPEIVSGAYDYVDRATVDEPANIAYGTGLDFTYPLWGSRLRNRVYYLEPRDFPSWIKKLRAKNIKYLLIKTDTPEHDLVGNRSLFTRTYFDKENGYAVYLFRG